ncbi:hypothetical protein APR04_004038 [Promicromonospora umidemergens]|uniref:Integral membrane protein n=1 Tax=Promicromonospora umidemergens TaxID=629679 RepID=A0ABP8X1I3_9MICO|nr:hypothetical protein [Promicromonospora umidemergens]MCP2285111.1 hypothetical protein [Promicromonospora umidemergens]
MSTEEPTGEPGTPRAGGRRARGEGFALLGETLLTGVLVLAGSIPVVTLPAALAAGAAHLRRHVGGYDTSVRGYAHDWLAAVRNLWVLGVLLLGVVAVVVANTGLTASGVLPGASAVRWVTWLAAACAAVVLVRAATAWSDDEAGGAEATPGSGSAAGSGAATPGSGSAPGSGVAARDAAGPRQVLARGAARSRDDLTGSALLLAALVMCVVLVWMLTPLVVVTGGLLSLAAVAVETRRLERSVCRSHLHSMLGGSAATEQPSRAEFREEFDHDLEDNPGGCCPGDSVLPRSERRRLSCGARQHTGVRPNA